MTKITPKLLSKICQNMAVAEDPSHRGYANQQIWDGHWDWYVKYRNKSGAAATSHQARWERMARACIVTLFPEEAIVPEPEDNEDAEI